MCLCGQTPDSKNYIRSCCANELERQAEMNQESRFNSGDMSKMEMMEFLKAKEQTPEEIAEFREEWARQVKNIKPGFIEKGEKIEVASAYMPKKEVPANETPREELLQRDVGILLKECTELRRNNDLLIAQNKILLAQNEMMFKTFKKISSSVKSGLERYNADL